MVEWKNKKKNKNENVIEMIQNKDFGSMTLFAMYWIHKLQGVWTVVALF